ncbi:MAG: heavy-metal-associated domain-containing protein [Runella sp.]
MRTFSLTLNIGLTGLVHLLCCWLPLLMVLFNTSSVHWLTQYRTPLLMLQVVFLGWSFYDLYLRPTHKVSLVEKSVFWTAVILSVVLSMIPHQFFQTESDKLAQAQFERVKSTRVIKLELEKPVASVEKLNETLAQIEGVVPSQIELNQDVISVRYKLGQTSEEDILNTLRREGFQVSMSN